VLAGKGISEIADYEQAIIRRLDRKRAVPLSYEQFRYGFANVVGEDERRNCISGTLFRCRRAAVPGGVRKLESVDGGEGTLGQPGAGSDADRLGRLGPYGPLGDRERGLQKAEAE
jgi:hypothetical protein